MTSLQSSEPLNYAEDTRPLCAGTPFVLTDVAHPRLVLKYGSHCLILDEAASIPSCNALGYGYYRFDTRHLSQWELTIDDVALSLLSSDTSKGYAASFLYTNPQLAEASQQQLKLQRQIVLDDVLWERISIENYSAKSFNITLKIKFQADFADMFEVRGLNRATRGQRMMPVSTSDGRALFLAYRGLDGCLSETVIEFIGQRPAAINDAEAVFELALPVREEVQFEMKITTRWDGQSVATASQSDSLAHAVQSSDLQFREWRDAATRMEADHKLVNLCLERGLRDIYILRQPSPKGYGIAAGIPWYCAIFGRDSAIAGWQLLPFHPNVARQCLEVLAAYQGTAFDAFTAEQPGRIMHELRLGELARLGVIPHRPYYGTVDATQLWLFLLCEYLKWSGDLDYITQLWPAVKLALIWLEEELEKGHGYVTYQREGPHGLENQGWKDSGDSIMHADGRLAEPPIAVCEAQSYLYAAWLGIAEVAELIGHKHLATKLINLAASLKERFQRDFWMPEENYVALALDGSGHQVKSISSNPGHCLWTGILDDDKANAVADRLMSSELQSGWGIRTLSSMAVGYNPLSYHNGSVWPHDNAIIAQGLRQLGRLDDVHRLVKGFVEAGHYQPSYRLPELFCGFDRANEIKPIDYPVSCSPQAWAAGALFQMISACLNFQPDALNHRLRIVDPILPEWFGNLSIGGLKVGNASIDMMFNNSRNSTFCQILRKSGSMKVIVEN